MDNALLSELAAERRRRSGWGGDAAASPPPTPAASPAPRKRPRSPAAATIELLPSSSAEDAGGAGHDRETDAAMAARLAAENPWQESDKEMARRLQQEAAPPRPPAAASVSDAAMAARLQQEEVRRAQPLSAQQLSPEQFARAHVAQENQRRTQCEGGREWREWREHEWTVRHTDAEGERRERRAAALPVLVAHARAQHADPERQRRYGEHLHEPARDAGHAPPARHNLAPRAAPLRG